MANFDLSSYETVEERHARALEAYPDLRSVIVNHTTPADRASGIWVVEARVFLNADEQERNLPKASEWAFEIDGSGMANKTSALENACTSALGRSLRWALGGSKGPSREEMTKVAAGRTPQKPAVAVPDFYPELIAKASDLPALEKLWNDAVAGGFSAQVIEPITIRKAELS